MIKGNELRLGNYVLINGKMYCIESINQKGVDIWLSGCGEIEVDPFDTLKPITLTKEILEKAGFVNDYGERWSRYGVEVIGRMPHFEAGYLLLNGEDRTHWANVIFYLHQLQNLYFALTAEELIIKL